MSLLDSPFSPPRSLRNRHLQSVLSSSSARARYADVVLQATGAQHETWLLEAGEGVCLQGILSRRADSAPETLVLLLHGWEGSANSSYVKAAAAQLIDAGLAVFRLNFRDHGDTHHLNPAIFHSGRIDEVVGATRALVERLEVRRLLVAGWSLGGNFALRLGLQAPIVGLPLQALAAICPALDPARTMRAMEEGFPIYLRHFERKWRRSLRRKRELFPALHVYDDAVLGMRMRPLTTYFAEQYTDYGSLQGYFDAYDISGAQLQDLPLPADILMAADDPVVPVETFHVIAGYPNVRIELASHGGHCGFLCNWQMHGYAETWLRQRFTQALAG